MFDTESLQAIRKYCGFYAQAYRAHKAFIEAFNELPKIDQRILRIQTGAQQVQRVMQVELQELKSCVVN